MQTNTILDWLSGGDLRSDGAANQAADAVIKNPELINDLAVGLESEDDVIRGRTADVLEKIARTNPELTASYVNRFLQLLGSDPLPMVRWHLAMVLGHLAEYSSLTEEIVSALLRALDDGSVFTKSWVIVSLCIYARKYPQHLKEITQKIARSSNDASAAVRTRVRYAMEVLHNTDAPFPRGWVKSERISLD